MFNSVFNSPALPSPPPSCWAEAADQEIVLSPKLIFYSFSTVENNLREPYTYVSPAPGAGTRSVGRSTSLSIKYHLKNAIMTSKKTIWRGAACFPSSLCFPAILAGRNKGFFPSLSLLRLNCHQLPHSTGLLGLSKPGTVLNIQSTPFGYISEPVSLPLIALWRIDESLIPRLWLGKTQTLWALLFYLFKEEISGILCLN